MASRITGEKVDNSSAGAVVLNDDFVPHGVVIGDGSKGSTRPFRVPTPALHVATFPWSSVPSDAGHTLIPLA